MSQPRRDDLMVAIAMPINLTQTLEELEGCKWGEPTFDSYVVLTCHALRRKPLADLTNEELRVGIGQHVGLHHLVPIALERLKSDPLVAASLYVGDLLRSVLTVPSVFWEDRPELRDEVEPIVQGAVALAADLGNEPWFRSWRTRA